MVYGFQTYSCIFVVAVVVVARTRLSNSPDTGKVTILMRKVMHRDHEQTGRKQDSCLL